MSLSSALYTGLRFSVIFTLLGFAPVLSVAMSAHDEVQIKRLIDAQIKLEKARLKIMEDNSNDLRESPDGNIQARSNAFALKTIDEDLDQIEEKISVLTELKDSINSRREASHLVGELKRLSGPCDFSRCIQMLGKMNAGLAQQLVDINIRVIIQEGDNFEIIHSPKFKEFRNTELALDASVELYSRSWACQRAIGKWTGNVIYDPYKMGTCFASLATEVAAQQNVKASPLPSPKHYLPPAGPLNPVSDDEAKKLADFVFKFPDYQLRPWDLYKYCLERAKGKIVEAASLCYGALRINRSRPDFKRKLMDIRGDRVKGGDNGGDWYHLFAMARAGMAYGSHAKSIYYVTPDVIEGPVYDAITKRRDKIEERNDMLGAEVGIKTSQIIIDKMILPTKQKSSKDVCNMNIFNFAK